MSAPVEGVHSSLKQNQWFMQNIAAKTAKAYYFETADRMVIQVAKIVDKEQGREAVFIVKASLTGYMKSIMRLSPGDAERLVNALKSVLA